MALANKQVQLYYLRIPGNGYNTMQYEDGNEGQHAGSWYLLKNVGLMLTGGVLVAGVLISTGVWRTGDRWFAALSHFWQSAPAAPKVDVQSVVIQQVRDASELTTAVFTMQAVVPTSQDTNIGGLVLGTTKLLYIAYGEVEAGVDLSQLTAANVQVTGDRVQITLPPPQILDSKIDVNRSNVYDYNRGFLGLGPDVAPELQGMAQQEALKKVVTSACEDGILQRASDRARFVVTQLLNTAGYKSVTVSSQSPSSDTCGVTTSHPENVSPPK